MVPFSRNHRGFMAFSDDRLAKSLSTVSLVREAGLEGFSRPPTFDPSTGRNGCRCGFGRPPDDQMPKNRYRKLCDLRPSSGFVNQVSDLLGCLFRHRGKNVAVNVHTEIGIRGNKIQFQNFHSANSFVYCRTIRNACSSQGSCQVLEGLAIFWIRLLYVEFTSIAIFQIVKNIKDLLVIFCSNLHISDAIFASFTPSAMGTNSSFSPSRFQTAK